MKLIIIQHTHSLTLCRLLQQTEDCKSIEVEKYLRQCIKSYPHIHSVLFKQLLSVIADVPLVSGCACIPTVKKHVLLISEGVLIFEYFLP